MSPKRTTKRSCNHNDFKNNEDLTWTLRPRIIIDKNLANALYLGPWSLRPELIESNFDGWNIDALGVIVISIKLDRKIYETAIWLAIPYAGEFCTAKCKWICYVW